MSDATISQAEGMQFRHILRLLALTTLANGTPIVAKKIFGPRFSFPLDAGTIFFDGRPLFGRRAGSRADESCVVLVWRAASFEERDEGTAS
jgi:hypothetical protein